MSSPVVNKDTLYFSTEGRKGSIFMILHGYKDGDYHGWSRYYCTTTAKGWDWVHEEELVSNPIGQRCILQW